MDFAKYTPAFLLMITTLFQNSQCAAVYKVGDSAGWTVIGNVDYNNWASTKNLHVGDTIVFEYNNQFHNVKQVTHQDFQSCNRTSSIAAYTTGSDSIKLKRPGHYYFLCGFPGHCEAGQKLDIMVTPASLRPSASPRQTPSSSSVPSGSSSSFKEPSSTHENTSSSLQSFNLWSALVNLAIFGTDFAY